MDIDAELRRQIVVSLAAVVVFFAGLVYIGLTYGKTPDLPVEGSFALPPQGAIALVGLLVGFVLLMAAVGAYLIRANGGS
ncbi:hypothetical protein ACFQAS_11060 [Halopenitus salinus]|jgi:hypothetical protein|uniref:Cox cluster protein n=1 Tax=Halopenitus salinus TaxID=1198295 RepID=A0ABD5UYT9_9EURY